MAGDAPRLGNAVETSTAFFADGDSYVASDEPDRNFGSAPNLRASGNPTTHIYLRFVVSGMKGSVKRAEVRLRVMEGTVSGPELYATSNDWGESSLTWNERPSTARPASNEEQALATGSWATYDVTPLVLGNGTVTFLLLGSSPDEVTFASRESADQPLLVVTADPSGKTRGVHAPALVAASHPLAAQAGADILRNGGNAIDAAAAVAFVLGVVEPHASGIGGGTFLVHYRPSTGVTYILDGRESAPAASTRDQFLVAGKPMTFSAARTRGFAVGVPGLVKTLDIALARWGTLTIRQVIGPAITLAERGFRVNAFLAQEIAEQRSVLASSPASAAIYLPAGTPLAAGELLQQPDLARTLRLIRDRGSEVFYGGEIGTAIVAAQARRGGRMTLADLRGYEVKERLPLEGRYGDLSIATMPPPSSGGLTMLQMLGMLEPLHLKSTGAGSVQTLHWMLEAMHLAYADRARFMGDDDYVAVPETGLLDPDYIAARWALVDHDRASVTAAPGDPWAYEDDEPARTEAASGGGEGLDTTHFVVIDRWGNVVTSTQTIEAPFGTGMTVPGYGFVLNNELTDFDFTPGGANEVFPGKRPRSSQTPTIVFRAGRPVFVLGSPGGARIITTVMQVFLDVVEHGMPIQQAIDAGRVHFSKFPSFAWESAIGAQVIGELQARGHVPEPAPSVGDDQGAVQAAVLDPELGAWVGGADKRREGAVIYVN